MGKSVKLLIGREKNSYFGGTAGGSLSQAAIFREWFRTEALGSQRVGKVRLWKVPTGAWDDESGF